MIKTNIKERPLLGQRESNTSYIYKRPKGVSTEYKFKHVRNERLIRTRFYKGFSIDIYKDKDTSICYTGVIRPISQIAKKICINGKRKLRTDKILDYTGWCNQQEVFKDKRDQIDSLSRCHNFRFNRYFIK